MRLSLEVANRKLLIEVYGLSHVFVETRNHEFFYSTKWWQERKEGTFSRWALDRKTVRHSAELAVL